MDCIWIDFLIRRGLGVGMRPRWDSCQASDQYLNVLQGTFCGHESWIFSMRRGHGWLPCVFAIKKIHSHFTKTRLWLNQRSKHPCCNIKTRFKHIKSYVSTYLWFLKRFQYWNMQLFFNPVVVSHRCVIGTHWTQRYSVKWELLASWSCQKGFYSPGLHSGCHWIYSLQWVLTPEIIILNLIFDLL